VSRLGEGGAEAGNDGRRPSRDDGAGGAREEVEEPGAATGSAERPAWTPGFAARTTSRGSDSWARDARNYRQGARRAQGWATANRKWPTAGRKWSAAVVCGVGGRGREKTGSGTKLESENMGNPNPNQGWECIYIAECCGPKSITIEVYTET
jgi:hypothetical protein